METHDNIPFEATHPGSLIKDELEVREDINQKELAKELGVKASFLNEIIKGKRSITADIAILLEKTLEIPADYWMRFQSQYEIDKARVKERNIERLKNIEIWKIIKEYVPVKYLLKNKYLSNNLENDIKAINQIYSINTIDDLVENVSKNKFAFYRKSDRLMIDEKNMLAWSAIANYEASKQNTNTFSFDSTEQLCVNLNRILHENNNTIEKVRELLKKYGIKFITIQKLEKTPIDGLSFWSGNNPAIALTLRYNRIDNFAFTLLHEIAHIELHLKNNKESEYLDLSFDKHWDVAEKEADAYAQNKLISAEVLTIIKNNIQITDDEIIAIGNAYQINPAILLGRICYERNDYAFRTKIDKKIK